jgi:hypothetical protein
LVCKGQLCYRLLLAFHVLKEEKGVLDPKGCACWELSHCGPIHVLGMLQKEFIHLRFHRLHRVLCRGDPSLDAALSQVDLPADTLLHDGLVLPQTAVRLRALVLVVEDIPP